MIYFLIFFFFVPFVFLYEFNINKNIKYVFSSIVLTFLILLTGLRGSVDGDYENYLDIYNNLGKYFSEYSTIVEPCYVFLNKFAFNFNFGFNFVLFIMAVITISPKVIFFFNNSSNFALSIIIFYSTIFFQFDFTQIRQAFAIAIFMYSLKFIINKNIYKYFLSIIFASLFHISALILIPGYFIVNKKYNKFILFFIVLICSIISLMQLKINIFDLIFENANLINNLSEKLDVYKKSELYSFISIKQILFGFLFVYIKDSLYAKNKFLNILVNLYVLGILFATLLNQISEVAYRIKWYFFWTESLLVILLITHLSKEKRGVKIFLNLMFTIYYFIIFIIILDNLSNNGEFIFPYKLFFTN